MSEASSRWMTEAIHLAVENVTSGNGGPFGAVIVRGDALIASGVNQVTRTHDPTAHAEIVAIRNACASLRDFQLAGCTLYASCEPCPMCLAASYWARLDAVYFACTQQDAAAHGFDDSYIYAEIRRPLSERGLPMHPLDHPEGLRAFEQWADAQDKVPY